MGLDNRKQCWWAASIYSIFEACYLYRGHILISPKLLIGASSTAGTYPRRCKVQAKQVLASFRRSVSRDKLCWFQKNVFKIDGWYYHWGTAKRRGTRSYKARSSAGVPDCPST